jgi:hypothetical protein
MSCDEIQEVLLDLKLDDAHRRRLTESLNHLEQCADCRAAFADYDAIRNSIRVDSSEVEPIGGWESSGNEFLSLAVPTRPRRNWAFGLAIAASLLVAVGAFEFGRLADRHTEPGPLAIQAGPSTHDEAELQFAPSDLNHEVNAFHQISRDYDGKAGWMLVSKDASDVGLSDKDVAAGGQVLVLRLSVTSDGNEISTADVLVVPGQTADLTVPLEGENGLHYRIGTSTDEPTRLTLMLELRKPTGAEPLAALSTNLRMQPGQKRTAGELCTSSNRYVFKVGFAKAAI